MNFKTTYVLFGVLIAMLVLMGLVLYRGPSESAGAGYLFPAFQGDEAKLKSKDVDKVVIERKSPSEAEIVFAKDADNNWKITAPRSLPTDSSTVQRMVDAIIRARIEEMKPPSLKESGLDSPKRIVKLTGTDIDLTLTIGESTLGGFESAVTYVQASSHGNTPLAVRKTDLESAMENVNYFRDKNLLGNNSNDVRAVKLTEGKKGTVELRKEKEHWRMVQPPYGDADVTSLLNSITGLSVNYTNDKESDFVEDGAKEKDLAKYNLDPAKAEVLRIEVTRGEGDKAKTTAVLVGVSKKVGDAKTGEKYYAALDDGATKDVVKISASSVEPIIKLIDDPGSLRSKNLVQLESFKTPDAIDVDNSYGKLEFRKPDTTKPWELYRGTTAVNVDESEVRQLIDALNKKDQVTSFPDPKRKKELGLEKPDVVVKIWADGLDKPDEKKGGKPPFKKDAKPAAELRFGNREGSSVAVERVWGNDSTIVMVPSTVLDTVRKGPVAYFDKTIPSYSKGAPDEDVTKVELTREGDTFEIVRDKPTDPWKLVKPASLKDRKASDQAVREILGEMNHLTAREVVTEKADANDLAKTYDLAKPPYRVVITTTKDKKSTTHEYDLGKDVPGKGVYFKLGGKDTVYVVNSDVIAPLKKELRDTTVFDFDFDKVVAVKLTGWKKLLGSPTTRTLEKKDGKWTCKEQKDFKVDATKVTSMLAGLSHMHAERFVPSGKELSLDQDAFQIEITLSDKKVLELTVGGADGSSYYATSNQLKGDVFLVSKDLFEEARKAPGYYSK